MKKVLLVTFSDNADHQDTLFGMYEEIYVQIKYTAKFSRCRFRPTKCRYFPDTVSLNPCASVAIAPIYALDVAELENEREK